MFIHGKLTLTHHKFMLDEIRSLLQKALRRKEWVLALQSAKELLAYDNEQLPWKCIITYLFEDHCLSDTDILMVIFKAFEERTVEAKYKCIELLLQCNTCRVSACLPVIALDTPYEPKNWETDIEVRESVRSLVAHEKGLINTDQLLEHLLRSWKSDNQDGMICYMKLATMVVENEKRQLTAKGRGYLITTIGKIKRPHFGLVVLSALYKNTDDPAMRGYLAACHRLATIPEVCVRLIIFSPLTRLMFSEHVSQLPNKKLGRVDWRTVRKLNHMPHWAVDKHTFRGKFGRASKTILKKKPPGMSESDYNEFHGVREKRDLQSFFNEGVKCTKEALEENPFWERMKEMYFLQPPNQQKTQPMTEEYYKTLETKYPEIFQANKSVFFDYKQNNGNATGGTGQRNLYDFFKPSHVVSPPLHQNAESNSPIFTMPIEPISSRQDSYGYASLSTRAPPPNQKTSANLDANTGDKKSSKGPEKEGTSSKESKSHSHSSGEQRKPDRKPHKESKDKMTSANSVTNTGDKKSSNGPEKERTSSKESKSHSHSSGEQRKPDKKPHKESKDKMTSDNKIHNHSSNRVAGEHSKRDSKSSSSKHETKGKQGSNNHTKELVSAEPKKDTLPMNSRANKIAEESLTKRVRISSIETSDAWHEGMSRAKRRRLTQTVERKMDYETDRFSSTRKVTGVMTAGFAEAAKKLGCPVTLPENLFNDDSFVESTARLSHSLSFSDESESDFPSVPNRLSSPLKRNSSDFLGNSSLSQSDSNHFQSISGESIKLDKDLINALNEEFEDDPSDCPEDNIEVDQLEAEAEEAEDEEAEEEEAEEAAQEELEEIAFRGPLLKLPTSANKVYAMADIEDNKVLKGPYRNKEKMHQVMFYHQCMRDVIGDPHTLEFEPDPPYLAFPLMKGHGATMEITTRDFTDCISQADIEDAEFLTRDCLGIVQLHKLSPNQIKKLPMTIWAHFLFRFALNIGDSGMFNAITDSKLTFVYGIDMEQQRGEITATKSILDIMFSKAPRKDLCEIILLCIRHKKTDLFKIVAKPINYAQMDRLAREYGAKYDRLLFIERIKTARELVAKL